MPPPNIEQQIFPTSIVTPLAQVTVVDGDEGDCNVVDFCRLATTQSTSLPPKTVYPDAAWRRTIIDTGPKKKATNIVATLELLATEQCYPALATDPTGADTEVPLLEELQITHPDDDHIGNAAAFLKAMCTTNSKTQYVKNCNVVFSQIPSLYEKPTITATRPTFKTDIKGNTSNECVYTASVDESWRDLMEKSGFALEIGLEPKNDKIREWNSLDNNAFWDDNTQNDVSQPTCTLTYAHDAHDASNNSLKPELEAQVRIFLPEQGNLVATTNEVKRKWHATISKNRDLLSSAYTEVEMVEHELQSEGSFALGWDPGPPTKINKFSQDAKLMLNMVMRQPLATANSNGINTSMKSAVKADTHIIHSVEQVLDLGTVITDLNTSKPTDPKSKTRPNLKAVVPVTSQIVRPKTSKELKSAAGQQYTIGPSAAQYKSMMRAIMLNQWELHAIGELEGGKNQLDSETTNRSSIVTMFERHDKDETFDASFSMLFTGDAYDKACDIRDTLLSWKSDSPTIQVDVLKIPHHGSDVSTSSGFYSFCRAYVYFVCGSHHGNQHGNPKLSTLEAIVKGFYGKTAPGGKPFRLFFSNPKAGADYRTPKTTSLSAVKGILQNQVLKPSDTFPPTGYYYEMYRLKNDTEGFPADYASFGQVVFGKDGLNNLVTWWDPDPTTGQWVKMVP